MNRRQLRKWWNHRSIMRATLSGKRINKHYNKFCQRKLKELGIMYRMEAGKRYNGFFDGDKYYKIIGDDWKRHLRRRNAQR